MQARLAVRIGAILLVGLAYVGLSHWLMTQARETSWNVVAVLTPMLLIIAVGGLRGGHPWIGGAAVVAIVALCVQGFLGTALPSQFLYLAQHAGINAALGLFFASTLLPGRTALITMVATRVHGHELTPAHARYSRNVTTAWVLFFAAVVSISLLLFAFASFDTWAVFANLLTPLATGAMFIGEYLLRYRLHPEFERASASEAVKAYMSGAATSARTAPERRRS
jgi:uncharacterized membrane protein